GGVTISALTQGGYLFDLSLGALTPEDLDDASTVDVRTADLQTSDGQQDVRNGTTIFVPRGYDVTRGEPGRVYRYVASTNDDEPNIIDLGIANYKDTSKWQPVESPKEDADGDRVILEAVRAAFASRGETLAVFDTVATASM